MTTAGDPSDRAEAGPRPVHQPHGEDVHASGSWRGGCPAL